MSRGLYLHHVSGNTQLNGYCWYRWRMAHSKGVSLMILGDADIAGTITNDRMVMAIEYAAENGADVINISQIFQADHPDVKAAVENACSQDVIVVCSAGNFGPDNVYR